MVSTMIKSMVNPDNEVYNINAIINCSATVDCSLVVSC